MEQRRRSNLLGGLLLILIGSVILTIQLLPEIQVPVSWPWIIIGFGLALFLIGTATGVPALAVPACIIGGLGGILYYQSITGDWDSWAYIWALIPGFVGLGLVVSALLGGDGGEAARAGSWLMVVSLVLFTVFGSVFGALGLLGDYWPVLLILLGLVLLGRPLLQGRQ